MKGQCRTVSRWATLLGIVAGIGAGGAARAADVTITFLNSERPQTYQPVIAEFEKENPGLTVRDQTVPFDQLNAQVQARIGTGDTSIDVYGVDEPRIPALATRRLLKDLSDVRSQAAAATTPEALAVTSYKDKLYALPEWTSTQLLFFNKDLLQKAGVALPSSDVGKRLTWDQVLADARAAQKAGARWGMGFEQVDRYYQLQPLFESNGAGSGLTGPQMLTPAVNTPKWIETLNWYGDLYRSGLAPRGIAPEQMPDLFRNGKLAFIVAGPWNFRDFEKATDLHWGIAPHPYFAGGKPVTPTDSWAVGLNPHSQHPAEALKFALFMTVNTKGDLLTTAQNPLPPANKAAFEQHVQQASAGGGAATAPYGTILNYELQHTAVSRPRTVGYVVFEQIMNRAFSDVRDGADAKAELARTDQQLRTAFSRLQ
jgi:ABC-type glycerol-3-phosphate transport system substrate-binding protein